MKVDVLVVQLSEQHCNQGQMPRDGTVGIIRNRIPIHANEIGKLPDIQSRLSKLIDKSLIVHASIYTCFYELRT